MKINYFLFVIAALLIAACEKESSTEPIQEEVFQTKGAVTPISTYVIVTDDYPASTEFEHSFRFEYFGPSLPINTTVKYIFYKKITHSYQQDTIPGEASHYTPVASQTLVIYKGNEATIPVTIEEPGEYKVVLTYASTPAKVHPVYYTKTFVVKSPFGPGW